MFSSNAKHNSNANTHYYSNAYNHAFNFVDARTIDYTITNTICNSVKYAIGNSVDNSVNIGGWRTRVADDHWTVHTADGSLAAHFEHTIAIDGEEPEILTRET